MKNVKNDEKYEKWPKNVKNKNFVLENNDEIELKTMFRILTSLQKKIPIRISPISSTFGRYHYNSHMLKV